MLAALFLFGLASFPGCAPSRLLLPHATSEYAAAVQLTRIAAEDRLWADSLAHIRSDKPDAALPTPAATLVRAARDLAALSLVADETYSPEDFLEPVLLRNGIVERPARAYWFTGTGGGLAYDGSSRIAGKILFLKQQGYTRIGLGVHERDDGEWAAALVATQRPVRLTLPVARIIPIGGNLRLIAETGDEIGVLWITLKSPNGHLFEQSVPYLAGQLDWGVRLHWPGNYAIEIRMKTPAGDIKRVAHLVVTVGERATQIPLFPPPPQVSGKQYPSAALGYIDELRTKSGMDTLTSLPRADELLAPWLQMEAQHLRFSDDGIERQLFVSGSESDPPLSCLYRSSVTNNPGALLAREFGRPSVLKAMIQPAYQGYAALSQLLEEGERIGELLCGVAQPSQMLLTRLPAHEDRLAFLKELDARLMKQMGLDYVADPQQRLIEWTLAQAVLSIEEAEARKERNTAKDSEKTPTLPHRDRYEQQLNETYASLWWVSWQLQQRFDRQDPRRAAVSLLLLKLLLLQDREDDYLAEMRRMEETSPTQGPWREARLAVAQAWMASRRGDMNQRKEALLRAIECYQHLQFSSFAQQLWLQASE